jgi:hypothetical protein
MPYLPPQSMNSATCSTETTLLPELRLPEGIAPQTLVTLVALHNIGKFTRTFQTRAPALWPPSLGRFVSPPRSTSNMTIPVTPYWPAHYPLIWRRCSPIGGISRSAGHCCGPLRGIMVGHRPSHNRRCQIASRVRFAVRQPVPPGVRCCGRAVAPGRSRYLLAGMARSPAGRQNGGLGCQSKAETTALIVSPRRIQSRHQRVSHGEQ